LILIAWALLLLAWPDAAWAVKNLTVAKSGGGSGTVTTAPAGIDCGSTCSAAFADGTRVTLTAAPAAPSGFDGWLGAPCRGNGPCTLDMLDDYSAIAAFNPDSDADNSSDTVENAGPYGGDGNQNGVRDSTEANVATLKSIEYVYTTLVSETGTQLAQVNAQENPSPADNPKDPYFPYGFFGFSVQGLNAGDSTVVTMILHYPLAITTYFKYGPTPDNPVPHWYEFVHDGRTGARIRLFTDATVIYLYLMDGERGDDDLAANGTITDVGAPGARAEDTARLKDGSGGGGGGGCFINSVPAP